MPKRRHSETIDVEDIIKTIDLNKGFRAGLDELTTDELTALLADLANSANIPISALQKPTPNLPSFSAAKWSEVARGLGMQSVASRATLEHFQTPKYYLPLSLHEAMFENAWRWHDFYRERPEQTREAARVRLLEPYIVPIIALFQGRLVDAPEETMMATKYSSGGGVEHEIYMIGGFMFLIVEFKLDMPKDHSLAQLFLELLSAAEMNKELSFKNLRVYGLLTDFLQFRFYSYDPFQAKFCMDEIITIGSERVQALSRMIKVSNKLFSILLSAYEDGLQAIIAQSKDRAKKTDFSSHSSAPAERSIANPTSAQQGSTSSRGPGGRRLTPMWEVALDRANQCIKKLREPALSLQDIEDNGNVALGFLAASVRSIPRVSNFTGEENDPSNPVELNELAVRVIKEEHEHLLAKLQQ